jgi:hypothetical protein
MVVVADDGGVASAPVEGAPADDDVGVELNVVQRVVVVDRVETPDEEASVQDAVKHEYDADVVAEVADPVVNGFHCRPVNLEHLASAAVLPPPLQQ